MCSHQQLQIQRMQFRFLQLVTTLNNLAVRQMKIGTFHDAMKTFSAALRAMKQMNDFNGMNRYNTNLENLIQVITMKLISSSSKITIEKHQDNFLIETMQLSTGDIECSSLQKIVEFKTLSPIIMLFFDIDYSDAMNLDELDETGVLLSALLLYNMGVTSLLNSKNIYEDKKQIACRTLLKLSLDLTQKHEFRHTLSLVVYHVLSLAIASLANTVLSHIENDFDEFFVSNSCHDMQARLHTFVQQVSDTWGISLENHSAPVA